MEKSDKRETDDADERAFNETLKRMLKTPPKPHNEKEKQVSDIEDLSSERGSEIS